MRKYLRIEDNGIYCKRCGNKILSDADAELCNTYTKNLYGKAVDVFCAQCHTRLFFDNSENVKSEAKPEQDAPPKPPRNSEIPPAAHDTGASGKIDSSGRPGKIFPPFKDPGDAENSFRSYRIIRCRHIHLGAGNYVRITAGQSRFRT